ncbi:MAG: HYR domain-containing protein, partial [Nitrosopumilaceae archaeon]
ATDTSGNSVTATQTVTIVDTTTPTILAPADVSVEASDPTSNIVAIGTATTSDAVGVVSVTSDAPSVFPFGQTIVTWTATDAAGNNATDIQTIIVVDTTAPKVFAPADVTADATDPTNNTIPTGTASATDIIGVASITSDAPAAFPFGETIVTWTAIDTSGNSATTTQKVTVIDTTAPQLAVPADITIDATSLESTIAIGNATVSDIIDSSPKVTNNSTATFPLGKTIITWTAADKFGNSQTLTQTVNVQACGKPSSSYNLIVGRLTDDDIVGTGLADLIFALAGNDIIMGGQGDDCIICGDVDDILFGDDGIDTIYAGNGNDIIKGGIGDDTLYGNLGLDVIDGGYDHDTCYVGEDPSNDAVINCEAGEL